MSTAKSAEAMAERCLSAGLKRVSVGVAALLKDRGVEIKLYQTGCVLDPFARLERGKGRLIRAGMLAAPRVEHERWALAEEVDAAEAELRLQACASTFEREDGYDDDP